MASALVPGLVVGGDFRVVRQLGAGGMGAVYEVQQLSTGERRALKVMHAEILDHPQLRERFEQEARAGVHVPSEHAVRVLAAGVDAQLAIPWIAMELLEGENLAVVVRRRGRLTPMETREILRQLCHALAAAHQSGLVHRDVKPENVFVARTHSSQRSFVVKVLDFGIAKVIAAAASLRGTSGVGTPLWMAPEQSDIALPTTVACDVWAVGLLAYWMLTGHFYWRAAESAVPSVPALFREILLDPLEPASLRATSSGVSLPGRFDAWFQRCVSRDPAGRWPNAGAAFAAFDAIFEGAPQQPIDVEALLGGAAPPSVGAFGLMATTPAPMTGASLPPPSTAVPLVRAAATPNAVLPSVPPATQSSPGLRSTGAPSNGAHTNSAVALSAPAPRRTALALGIGVTVALLVGGAFLVGGVVAVGALAAIGMSTPDDDDGLAAGGPQSSAAPVTPASAVASASGAPDSARSARPAPGTAPLPGAGTTSPGTTSPGTTSPGTTSPGTTSPGTTPPTAPTVPVAPTVGGKRRFDRKLAEAAMSRAYATARTSCPVDPTTTEIRVSAKFDTDGRVHSTGGQGDLGFIRCFRALIEQERIPPFDDYRESESLDRSITIVRSKPAPTASTTP